jgi:hypothetical protein
MERQPRSASKAIAASLDGTSEDRTVYSSERRFEEPKLSPDGSLMCFMSDETGKLEVYCTTFPEGEGRRQVSTNGGGPVSWSPDSSATYFLSESTLYAVAVQRDLALSFGMPEPVLDFKPLNLQMWSGFCVGPGGERFLTIQNKSDAENFGQISVIENWFGAFREPTKP